jgi:signal transduction histidine kinase
VSLLERPVRTLTLITSLQSVLRARDKQYQVRETDRRKDEFLASLGHELRNPLAPIRTSMGCSRICIRTQAPVARSATVVERQVRPHAAGGRPARRGPHQQRQDRTAARVGVLCGGDGPRQ